jgi:hypothetical protein
MALLLMSVPLFPRHSELGTTSIGKNILAENAINKGGFAAGLGFNVCGVVFGWLN